MKRRLVKICRYKTCEPHHILVQAEHPLSEMLGTGSATDFGFFWGGFGILAHYNEITCGMGIKSKRKIHLCFIYSLWIYRFYLGYKNRLNIAFIWKYLHLYSAVFTSASKSFGFWRFSVFGISDKGYSTCNIKYTINTISFCIFIPVYLRNSAVLWY
jgi:hypothetical protein